MKQFLLMDFFTFLSDLKVEQVRCGEHSDYGSITLLFQDNVGGLEVRESVHEDLFF